MLYRHTYLEKDRSLGNSGERTVDINIQEPITALWVEMRATNGGTHNPHNPVHECISAIEIIDGADVICSVNGEQLLAMVCADLGYFPHQRFSALGGDPQSLALPVMFGRYLGDKEFALDPSRFTNPQLRVKWNLATNTAVGANGFVDGGLTMTVIAEVMANAVKPSAYLMRKEHYTWSTAVGTEYIDLPTDLPYRSLMFRGHKLTYHPFGVISDIKLNCNGGAFVPMDMAVEDLLYLEMMRQPRLSYRISDHLLDGGTFYSYLNEIEDVQMIGESLTPYIISYENYEYGSQVVNIHTDAGVGVGWANVGVHVHGYCPFGYIVVPFGDPNDRADWFPAPTFQSIRLEAKGAVAVSECDVCLVQEKRY